MSDFAPHTKWTRGSKHSYLYRHFVERSKTLSCMLTDKVFIRGTDWQASIPGMKEVHGAEAADWLFGGRVGSPDGKGVIRAYVGLTPLANLKSDLYAGMPSCMRRGGGHTLPYQKSGEPLTLFAGCGGAVDSGLHFDENLGGFLYMVSGQKQALMFPQVFYVLTAVRSQAMPVSSTREGGALTATSRIL
jgi:hypothetical protein